MLNQDILNKFALTNDIPIIGFSKARFDNKEYLSRLESKQANNNLYRKEQALENYYNVSNVLKDAQTIISIGIPYSQSSSYNHQKNYATYSITSYGIDYHQVVFKKMELIIDYLKEYFDELNFYMQCDTGVLDDRFFAYLCQNGVYGKHSQIINPDYGSQVFYGTIVINQEIPYEDKLLEADLCKDCRLCLDVCPTKSIDNHVLNYQSCLSYLSQSHNIIRPELLSNCFYGCDLCSNICPYNKKDSYNHAFEEENASINIIDFLLLSKKEYQAKYHNKGFSWLNRNILRKNMILLLDLNREELDELEVKLLTKDASVLLKEAFAYQKKRK